MGREEGKMACRIPMGRRHYFVGNFADEVDAARAADTAILRLAGEFARLNLPDVLAW